MPISPVQPDASQQTVNYCDLVMKGGLTSGVVYPPAALALKNKYTFRNIGGTSAGAIAAAGIAAAEFNRNNGGFDYLDQHVRQWLGKGNNLSNLFQAAPQTKPLLDLLHALLLPPSSSSSRSTKKARVPKRASAFRNLWTIIRLKCRLLGSWLINYPPLSFGIVLGMLLGVILAVVPVLAVFAVVYLFAPASAAHGIGTLELFLVILGILGAWVAWHIGGILSALAYLPKNFYGICSGHSDNAALKAPNLTDWLYAEFQKMAGEDLQRPLTFERLRATPKQIDLKMITSNLSHSIPYLMPEGLSNFIFKKSEMDQLFPEVVVQHMIKNQPEKPLIPREKLPELSGGDEYYYLPNAEKIPIIVCTRMSLSFPILLSAVPLYTISTQAYSNYVNRGQNRLAANAMQLNWFSDGGICSNFPIQFFDDWLPPYPTFGINLDSLSHATSAMQEYTQGQPSSAATQAALQGEDAIYLPKPEDAQDPEWSQLNGLFDFALALFGTAQNYRDTLQANLPSYRERIVQVRLDETEGGLNLTMPTSVIDRIVAKGHEAGMKLCDPNEFNFDHHVWVRFLVLMAQLEKNIVSINTVLDNPYFRDQLQKQLSGSPDPRNRYPYWQGKDRQWYGNMVKRVEALQVLISAWNIAPKDQDGEPCFFQKDAPAPQPTLRVTPEV